MKQEPVKQPVQGQHIMPYEYAYKAAMLALRDLGWHDFPVATLIAIGLKEHSCNPFMTIKEPLFTQNMWDFTRHTGISQQEFFEMINAAGVRQDTQFPAFRFEPSWVKHAKAMQPVVKCTDKQVMLLACSWGVGQKGGWIYLAEDCQDRLLVKLLHFMWTPNLQWQQIAKDMKDLLADANGDLALAATKYNAGRGAHLVSSYGRRVEALRDGVVEVLTKEGMALCLDSLGK